MLTNKCYVGIEAEGPHQDKKLLFVPGCTTPQQFQEAWSKVAEDVQGVYFGAGGYRKLSRETLAYIRVYMKKHYFMIETITSENDLVVIDVNAGKLYKKHETPHFVTWDEGSNVFLTWLDDPRFLLDKEV